MTNLTTVAVPAPVHGAFLAWLAAIAAGVVEAAVHISSEGVTAGGLAVRAAIYALAVWTFAQMRNGRNWARIALTLVLGGLGTLSLVIEPIGWLLAGNSLGTAIADAGVADLAIATSRTAHLAAVVLAVVLMYRPAANRYFR